MRKSASMLVILAVLTSSLPARAFASEEPLTRERAPLTARRLDSAVATLERGRRPSLRRDARHEMQRKLSPSGFGQPSRKANAIALAIVLGALIFFACVATCAAT